MRDTIFALASARGKAGVAVFRISGPCALDAAERLGVRGLVARRASLRRLVFEGDLIDEAIVLWFPAMQSFTGEDVVELQVHGSAAVLSRLTAILSGLDDLRMAEPGEFTRRALAAGRMDLTEVEALADLIDAETEAQRRQAQRILSGEMGRRVDAWRRSIVRATALIEATIDFADEDVPEDVVPEVLALLTELREAFSQELSGYKAAERIREGFEVAIVGSPNAGKSSLINALVGRRAALTSPVPGTTRDVIEVRLDLGGLPVTILDTAGLRETTDDVEAMGIRLARERAERADLRVLLAEPGYAMPQMDLAADDIVVFGKSDVYPGVGEISSVTGAGLDKLVDRIQQVLAKRVSGAGILVRERHRRAMIDAIEAIDGSLGALSSPDTPLELVAADLRRVTRMLERLVGRVDIEDLLGEIFASFCIGK
jgi:tRNA modification GTPase